MSMMSWLSRAEIVALGWTLLHFCWQGTAVAVVYSVIDRMTSRATSGVRYMVALLALTLMPVVVLATFVEEMRIADTVPANLQTGEAITKVDVGALQRPILREIPLAPMVEERGAWFAARAERVLPWVDGVWMFGVLLLALRAMGGWWQLEHLRRRALGLVPEELERGFRRICEQIQVGRWVSLRVSNEVISPLAMGVWRATVILPVSAVLGMPMEELEAVLAHELGHIRRWDYLCNLFQTTVESVLFFHPSVWSLSRTVRERREVCCDEIAVRSCAGATIYARALLRLEEQRTVQLRLAMALGGCHGSLLRRVKQVLGEGMAMENRMTSGVRVAAVGAVVAALLLGPKITEAVATPMVDASQRVIAPVLAALPRAVTSPMVATKAQAVKTPVAAPAAALAPQADPSAQLSESAPMPMAAPVAHVRVEASVSPEIELNVRAPQVQAYLQAAEGTASPKGMAYLDGMRDAGYPLDLNNDLNTLVSLKSLGVTPEYAKSMSAAGLGKPTVHELITLKSLGVTPDYVATMKQSGIPPKDFREVVTEKSLGITPEYANEMKQKGFGDMSLHELIAMKSMGVTPEYAAAMKQLGLGDLSAHDLIALKAQGMTPEYARWLKQQFPQAGMQELHRAAAFHVDEKFVAQAKSHGFDGKDLDKLLRLKMSGLLD
jgi:beta-lactamase regulating signal transducer with metallopeptidase domain